MQILYYKKEQGKLNNKHDKITTCNKTDKIQLNRTITNSMRNLKQFDLSKIKINGISVLSF